MFRDVLNKVPMTVKVRKRKLAEVSPSVDDPPVDSSGSAWSLLYGSGPGPDAGPGIDPDTISSYIHRIYCRECRMEEQRRKEGEPVSAPQTTVEDQSLQQTMDKNKESLKRKLMLRRSVNELVDQGIYPPLKTPPAFAEQIKHLERAKTGDLLRHKLQQRPDRQSLVQHHILEDTTVDPSLQDRQRQLKKSRLQDSLRGRLASRPGPLELVEGNILQTEPELKDAIKDGTLTFTKTSEMDETGSLRARHDRLDSEESSASSDTALSPLQTDTLDPSVLTSGVTCQLPAESVPSPPDITPLLLQQMHRRNEFKFAHNIPPITSQSFSSGSSSVVSSTSVATLTSVPTFAKNGTSIASKLSRIKKAKPKSMPKNKVIKFHEYKGPPSKTTTACSNVVVPSAVSAGMLAGGVLAAPHSGGGGGSGETPYHMMLQQQQLFLQWQLEFQQKNLPFALPLQTAGNPAATPPNAAATPESISSMSPTPTLMSPTTQTVPDNIMSPTMSTTSSSVPSPITVRSATPRVAKLEDMKVADLKQELKKRNLHVSGPKPHLIERLRPYAGAILDPQAEDMSTELATTDTEPPSPCASLTDLNASFVSVSPMSPPELLPDQHSVPPPIMVLDNPQLIAAHSQPIRVAYEAPLSVRPPSTRPPSAVPMDVDSGGDKGAQNTSQPNLTSESVAVQPQQRVASQEALAQLLQARRAEQITARQTAQPPVGQPQVAQPQVAQPQVGQPMVAQTQLRQPQVGQPQVGQTQIGQTQIGQPQVGQPQPQVGQPQVGQPQVGQPQVGQLQVGQPQVGQPQVGQPQVGQPQVGQLQVGQPQMGQPQVGQTMFQLPVVQPQLTAVGHTAQPAVMSHEQLVKQQQRQIEELQRLLQQSQLRLLEAEKQRQQNTKEAASKGLPVMTQVQVQSVVPPQQQLLKLQTQLQLQQQQLLQQQQQQQQQQQLKSSEHKVPQQLLQQTVTPSSGVPAKQVDCRTALSKMLHNQAALQQQQQQQQQPAVSATVDLPKVFSFAAIPNGQQFIFTAHPALPPPAPPLPPTQHRSVKIETLSPASTSTVSSMASVMDVANTNKSSSVPSSPVTHNKLQRSTTNPFFTNTPPQPKEPPKYDEAMKNRQNLLMHNMFPPSHTTDANANTTTPTSGICAKGRGSLKGVMKSQAMDDVLEILIRNGELPPSAAQEPPPTPKTNSTTLSLPIEPRPGCSRPPAGGAVFSGGTLILTSSTMTPITTASVQNVTQMAPLCMPMLDIGWQANCGVENATGKEPGTQPTNDSEDTNNTTNSTTQMTSDQMTSDQMPANFNDLSFITMDWADSDLPDHLLDMPTPDPVMNSNNLAAGDKNFLLDFNMADDVATELNSHGENGGVTSRVSEPNLGSLSVPDLPADPDISMDVSDWLDVIMPNTGLTPLSSNAPVCFPSDPVLTPKPQDVLDLFNMDEDDLYTPTEVKFNFDKVMEVATTNN